MDVYRHTSAMEPLLPKARCPRLSELTCDILKASGNLTGQVHSPVLLARVADLVREMNCYYSNLIEGHKTTPRDIERMDECNRQCRERLKRKESIAQPSAEFHLAMIAATQNQFLLRTANSFYLATRAWREQVFDDIEVCRRSIRDHQALRDAIALGQVSRARELMAEHLQVADHYWHDWHASVSTRRKPAGRA